MMSWKLTKSKLELLGPFDDDYLLSLKVATRGHMGAFSSFSLST